MREPAAENAVIEEALAAYDVEWSHFDILPAWYGIHLRVRVWARDGVMSWQLRERPSHIPLEAWRLHHELQPELPELETVATLARTRTGSCHVSCGERDFELISWLPGVSHGLVKAEQFRELGLAVGQLHNWLFQKPAPRHSNRTVATTNDMSWWIGELRRDSGQAVGTNEFCDLAESLLASLPPGPMVAIHGDIHPYNVLWREGKVSGFCDWEDAHLNAPTFDLAYLLAHSTFIEWPKRLEQGQEAYVNDEVNQAHSRLLLTSYRETMKQPLETTGFQRALVMSWVSTMRLTVLRNFVNEPCITAGRRLLDWLADPESIREWETILKS